MRKNKAVGTVSGTGETNTSVQRFSGSAPVGDATVKSGVTASREFKSEPALIHVELGATLNVGNFESIRITVGLTQPCYPEEKDAVFASARDWVASRMKEEQLLFRPQPTKQVHKPSIYVEPNTPKGSILTSELPSGDSTVKKAANVSHPVYDESTSPEVEF